MARAARMIGDGGVIGWLAENTIEFPDEAVPTYSYIQLTYKGSGIPETSCNFVWDTTWTAAAIRSAMKDRIRQDIIDTLGVTIPRTQIKVSAPE